MYKVKLLSLSSNWVTGSTVKLLYLMLMCDGTRIEQSCKLFTKIHSIPVISVINSWKEKANQTKPNQTEPNWTKIDTKPNSNENRIEKPNRKHIKCTKWSKRYWTGCACIHLERKTENKDNRKCFRLFNLVSLVVVVFLCHVCTQNETNANARKKLLHFICPS